MSAWLKALLISAALYLPLAMCTSQVDRTLAENGSVHIKVEPATVPATDLMSGALSSLAFDLMEWTALHLNLPDPDYLPQIVMTERCVIHRTFRPLDSCPTNIGLAAGYTQGKIWLQETWQPNNVYDLALLVHELAHHIQAHASVSLLPCHQEAMELPAYEAQFEFIRKMGSDPWMVTGLTPEYYERLTTCPR